MQAFVLLSTCLNMIDRYNHLNSYLKNKFGKRTLKICVDGGFSCPNRDGTKGYGGCIFCGSKGAGENIKGVLDDRLMSIRNQIEVFLSSYRGERADNFIVYFQSFSGTYADIDTLKKLYETALSVSDKIVGLEVATRPDLINYQIAKMLSLFKDKYYVCVELGLQTADDDIGNVINRCYSTDDYINACKILNEFDIDIVAHLMVGLPGESEESILHTVQVINESKAKGIKIHNTYVLANTKLQAMMRNYQYTPITLEYYVDTVAKIIKNLDKKIIVHRITGDPPKEDFVAPEWALHKKIILNGINAKLDRDNIYQGDRFKEII